MSGLTLKPIAHIQGDFATKFGIPRQSGMAEDLLSAVVFAPEYRDANALRGLEGYSHIWLIWGFSEVKLDKWLPMVKPPRLGGNRRQGVFATRSPFRPNPIGLSSVKLEAIEDRPGQGKALIVSGADLMDGTPIYDIKPYLPFTDSHPEASCGFAEETIRHRLSVEFPEELLARIPEGKRQALIQALALDPRPGYRNDPEEPFGFYFAGLDVRFRVKDGALRVFEVAEKTRN